MLALVQACWTVFAILVFGLALGVEVTRRSRLPAYFAPTLILASAALVGYGLFVAHLIHAYAARQLSRVVWLAALGAFGWLCLRREDDPSRATSPLALFRRRDVWLPVLLASLLAAAYLCTLYARDAPLNVRFTWLLPPDNLLPEIFALRLGDGIRPGHGPVYLFQQWQSSDRPPLQAGLVAATIPLRISGALPQFQYQVLGTVCQIGWVLACYLLACVLRLSRASTILILLTCAGSGFFLLNSLYVWPKLLAAWLLLTAVGIVLEVRRERRVASRWLLPLAAALSALSLLSHGGTIFSLPALLVFLPATPRELFRPRDLALALLVAVVLLAPWSIYQRLYDPPGTALLKQHLAGVETADGRGVTETIRDAYAALSPADIAARRFSNITAQVLWEPKADDETLADYLRRQQFFHHSATLDVLGLGLLVVLLRRDMPDVRRLFAFAIVSLIVWIGVLFQGGQAIVHQGSYVATTLLFFCGAAGVARLPRRLSVPLAAVHVGLFGWLWLVARQTARSTAPLPWQPGMAVAALLLFVAFGLALRLVPDAADALDNRARGRVA